MVNRQADITLDELKRGSDAAFRQVYEANRDKFLNYAKRYSLPDDDVIDIYQDAYIIFYNNIVEGKITQFTSSISTYLFSIGKHLIQDRMRKNEQERRVSVDRAAMDGEAHWADEALQPLDIDQPALTAEQQLLKTHFATLGKKCRELLTLFYYRGYTIKDILELGEYHNENVIKSQKSRCMKNLRDRINASIK